MSEPRADPWLVLRTRSRHENTVETVLKQKQIVSYLPKCKVVQSRLGKKKLLEMPLFPGYVFVRPTLDQFAGMRYIRGSCGLVLADSKPAAMPEKDLDAVKLLVESGATLTVDPELVAGTRVKVVDGPFMGVEGELILVKDQQVLVINVSTLGSSVRVEVGREAISIV